MTWRDIKWTTIIQGIPIIDLNNLDEYDVREYYYVKWQKEKEEEEE